MILFESIVKNCENHSQIHEVYCETRQHHCWGISGPDIAKIAEIAAMHGLTGAKFEFLGRNYFVYWSDIEFVMKNEIASDKN